MHHEGSLPCWTPTLAPGSKLPSEHEPRARRTFPIPYPVRQASVTRRIDTCDPDDTPAVGLSALRGKIASFGPFRLHATERLLEKNGIPLKIGSRALDILITLLEHAPEVVSRRDLIRRVWGKLVVDEVSLRFHVAGLRKRLGDGDASVSYITNIPGRGYCFAGAVSWSEATPGKARTTVSHLPREPLAMVGRDNALRELTTQL